MCSEKDLNSKNFRKDYKRNIHGEPEEPGGYTLPSIFFLLIKAFQEY